MRCDRGELVANGQSRTVGFDDYESRNGVVASIRTGRAFPPPEPNAHLLPDSEFSAPAFAPADGDFGANENSNRDGVLIVRDAHLTPPPSADSTASAGPVAFGVVLSGEFRNVPADDADDGQHGCNKSASALVSLSSSEPSGRRCEIQTVYRPAGWGQWGSGIV